MISFKVFLEQKKQWDSDSFKQWFGNSVVRDGSGNPLRVYTGTSKDTHFNSFRGGRAGLIWFTSDADSAGSYALDNESMKFKRMPGSWDLEQVNTKSRTIPVYLKIENPYIETNPPKWSDFKAQSQDILNKMRGHDGYILNVDNHFIYVVTNPLQIKSALANKGTFDPKNKNIIK